MSATKWLAKHLPAWTMEQLAAYRDDLREALSVERNRMIRSSLAAQLVMVLATMERPAYKA